MTVAVDADAAASPGRARPRPGRAVPDRVRGRRAAGGRQAGRRGRAPGSRPHRRHARARPAGRGHRGRRRHRPARHRAPARPRHVGPAGGGEVRAGARRARLAAMRARAIDAASTPPSCTAGPPARAGRIEAAIGRDRGKGRMAVDGSAPRQAVTHFQIAELLPDHDACSTSRSAPAAPTRSASTWRRSAILSWATPRTARRAWTVYGLRRQFLHACRLQLPHPVTGEELEVSSDAARRPRRGARPRPPRVAANDDEQGSEEGVRVNRTPPAPPEAVIPPAPPSDDSGSLPTSVVCGQTEVFGRLSRPGMQGNCLSRPVGPAIRRWSYDHGLGQRFPDRRRERAPGRGRRPGRSPPSRTPRGAALRWDRRLGIARRPGALQRRYRFRRRTSTGRRKPGGW